MYYIVIYDARHGLRMSTYQPLKTLNAAIAQLERIQKVMWNTFGFNIVYFACTVKDLEEMGLERL